LVVVRELSLDVPFKYAFAEMHGLCSMTLVPLRIFSDIKEDRLMIFLKVMPGLIDRDFLDSCSRILYYPEEAG